MTDLTVRAVISAVDNLTGPLQAMAARLNGLQTGLQRTGTIATTVGMASAAALAAPVAAVATFAMKGQEDIDRALRQYQVIGNATVQQRKEFERLVMGVGPKIGTNQLELIEGGKELLQAGLLPEDLFSKGEKGVALFERLALGAKVGGEKIGNLAQQLQLLAQSFGFAMGTPAEKARALEAVMGTAIVAPRFSPDTPAGHMMALRQFGPLLAPMMQGTDPMEILYQASALQNVLAKSFPGAAGGMALKTILQRLQNPTPAARLEMMQLGFDYGKVFGIDPTALSPNRLFDMLKRSGVDSMPKEQYVAEWMKKLAGGMDLNLWIKEFGLDMPEELGIPNKGERAKFQRAAIKKAVENMAMLSRGQFNIEAFLGELSKMDPMAFKDLAGLHHAPKAAILSAQGSIAEWARILAETRRQAPGAVDQGAVTMLDGWAFSLERARRALDSLRNTMWNAGAGDMWIGIMTKIGDALLAFSGIDPGVLDAIGKGLSAIVIAGGGLAAAGLAIRGLAFALAPLAALAASPFWLTVAAAGGLGALLIGNSQALFGADFSGSALVNSLQTVDTLLKNINGGFASWREHSAKEFNEKIIPGLQRPVQPNMDAWDVMYGDGKKSWWDTIKGLFGGGSSAIGGAVAPVAKLEGQGTVTVNVKVEGPGKVTSIMGSDDGRNIRMKTGVSMPDTNSPMP